MQKKTEHFYREQVAQVTQRVQKVSVLAPFYHMLIHSQKFHF